MEAEGRREEETASQACCHGRLSGLSSMTSPWWIHADHSWLFCPSCACKWFPGWISPSPFQALMWCWPACCSLGPPCPQGRQEGHWLCSSSSRHHSHSQIAKSSLMMTSVRSPSAYGYIPSGPTDSHLSSFLKCSLTWSFSTQGIFCLLHVIPWSLGPGIDELQSW